MLAFTILGLPAHPLIVHGAVVGIPLASLGALAYFLLPAKRTMLWWPLVVTTVITWLFSFFSGSTGKSLEHALHHSKFIEAHTMWAGRLGVAVHVLAASVLVALLLDRYGDRVKSASFRRVLRTVAGPVACIAAVASLVLVGIVGHLGAQAAWHNSPAASASMRAKTKP